MLGAPGGHRDVTQSQPILRSSFPTAIPPSSGSARGARSTPCPYKGPLVEGKVQILPCSERPKLSVGTSTGVPHPAVTVPATPSILTPSAASSRHLQLHRERCRYPETADLGFPLGSLGMRTEAG